MSFEMYEFKLNCLLLTVFITLLALSIALESVFYSFTWCFMSTVKVTKV